MRLSSISVALTSSVIALVSATTIAAPPPGPDAAAISASIASADRPPGDKERDAWAKPDVVLNFLGARPGMHVIDYLGGDGYSPELLARIVGPQGQVILYNNGGYASYAGQRLAKRFDGRQVPNTLQRVDEIADLKLPADSLDAALFVMSYHDVYFTPRGASAPMGDATQMVRALFTALKPGGVVVVQDHVAAAGSDPKQSVDKLHRIDPELVKRTFTEAGFAFDGEGDAFRNASDDHSKLVFDPAVRHKTDQFLYRFRKPR
jgi:predicted methyltransferase